MVVLWWSRRVVVSLPILVFLLRLLVEVWLNALLLLCPPVVLKGRASCTYAAPA